MMRSVGIHGQAFLSSGLMLLLIGTPVEADLFLLKQGGRVRGSWLNPRANVNQYVIATSRGGRIVLEKSLVREVIREHPDLLEYEQRAAHSRDTIAAHWQLAQWCQTRRLKSQRRRHLRRIVEIDPDHARARHALGYSNVRGEWVTQEGFQRKAGYVRYRGKWRLPQEAELLQKARQRKQAESAWVIRIRHWRNALLADPKKNPQRRQNAYRQLTAIDDEVAIPALSDQLQKESVRELKLLYIAALGNIGTPQAIEVLIQASMNDSDPEVFHAASDQIVKRKPPQATKMYVTWLKDNHNSKVRRAAQVLGRLEDRSAVSPLIDALVTTHRAIVGQLHPGLIRGINAGIASSFTYIGEQVGHIYLPLMSRTASSAMESVPPQVPAIATWRDSWPILLTVNPYPRVQDGTDFAAGPAAPSLPDNSDTVPRSRCRLW